MQTGVIGKIYPRIDKIELLANFFNIEKSNLVESRNQKNENQESLLRIPILKSEKTNINWSKNIIGYLTDTAFCRHHQKNIDEYFALEVSGDSMLPLLNSGDLVIVHKQDWVENGQTAVIFMDNELCIKKIMWKENHSIDLISMNPYYPILHFSEKEMKKEAKIVGKVVEAQIKGAFQ